MDLLLENQQFSVDIPMLENRGTFAPVEFIIDTGFTGTVFVSVNKNWDFFRFFECTNLELLNENKWVILADGERKKTYSAEITLRIKNEAFPVYINICVGTNIETPLLGVRFLEMLKAKFSIDFEQQKCGIWNSTV